MVHGLRTNPLVSGNFMAIKTDMSKAYDRVEWNFLEVLMEKMGFDRIWIRWIMACVCSVSYSVLLNGRSHGFIKPERGIRQGDPLSPFLFILCAEGLVNCLNQAESSGSISGIRLATSGPAVHHLLFADDSLLMCQATVDAALSIAQCLKDYGDASGQEINKLKSSIIFGAKVAATTKAAIKQALNIDKEGGEGSYLGLPECFSGSKRELFRFLRDKLQGRLKGWFSKALSQGGKEVLLKSICLSLPVYAMSCFKLPKDVCAKLTSAMIEFWWSSGTQKKKISWVAWKKLCKSKENGGLGFKDIEMFNQALLGKQAWRLWSNPQSLLAQILHHRYHRNRHFSEASIGTRPSFAWRSILHGRNLLQLGLLRSIGSGMETRVWVDNWLLDKIHRPPRYSDDAVVDLSLPVSGLINPILGTWNEQVVRNLIHEDDVPLVLQTKISRGAHDTTRWGFSRDGEYSTRSGYALAELAQEIEQNTTNSLPTAQQLLWSKLWKSKTSPKLRHFLWRAMSNALVVRANLCTRGIPVESSCPICHAAPETTCHMLFHCPHARLTWDSSLLPLPNGGFSTSSMALNLQHLLSCSNNRRIPIALRLAFPWILWHIWKSRNRLIFDRQQPNHLDMLNRALTESDAWLQIHNKLSEGPTDPLIAPASTMPWTKPPPTFLKCNIGVAWSGQDRLSGASWILRDHEGNTVMHSRRAFSQVLSLPEAELSSLLWALESMRSLRFRHVYFETSFHNPHDALLNSPTSVSTSLLVSRVTAFLSSGIWGCLSQVVSSQNRAAASIAFSVTRDHRLQSYVARSGPLWLSNLLASEARDG